jgi:hypothetical protein
VPARFSIYPSATNTALGVNKWGSGPSVAFVRKNGESPWVFGAVVNNIWSFGGPPQSSDRTNSLLVNPFISYHFGDGWSIGSSPNVDGWPDPRLAGARRLTVCGDVGLIEVRYVRGCLKSMA